MRADEVKNFAMLEEALVVPSLGGDGAITIKGISFGRKIQIATETDQKDAATTLVSETVYDADGILLMPDIGSWDAFAVLHEMDFLNILMAARRVSGFDAETVKKD